jgi:regulator of chromosome condensation
MVGERSRYEHLFLFNKSNLSSQGNDGTLGFFKADSISGTKIQLRPAVIPHLKDIIMLAAGSNHMLALDTHGSVFAWGADEQDQLGVRQHYTRFKKSIPKSKYDSLLPATVFLPHNIVSISCGAYHSFAVNVKGRVYAWGLNNYGQTGVPNEDSEKTIVELPRVVRSLAAYEIRQVAGGNHHSIACCEGGEEILVWGRCDDNQMGLPLDKVPPESILKDGRCRPSILLTPTQVPGKLLYLLRGYLLTLIDVDGVFVDAGIDHSICVTDTGEAYSWGFSSNYRTGLRTEDSIERPTLIDNSTISQQHVVSASCGGQFLVLACTPKMRHAEKGVASTTRRIDDLKLIMSQSTSH